jgi:hypothetical protein
MSMQPDDAARLIEMFLGADSIHRAQMLRAADRHPQTIHSGRSPACRPRRHRTGAGRLSSDAAGFTPNWLMP